MSARGGEYVQSFGRGLSVIRAFRGERRWLTVQEVALEAGLTIAAARRFLLTLVDLGFVVRKGREFGLRPRVLDLGYSALAGTHLPALVRPYLEALVREVDESAALSVLEGTDIVSIVRVPTRRMITVGLPPGSRLPAHCSSAGRVLLAGLGPAGLDAFVAMGDLERRTTRTLTDVARWREELARVAKDGYAVVDQELEDGLLAIAVPVHDGSGAVVAALNVSVDAIRADRTLVERTLLGPLKATAGDIELVVRAAGPAGLSIRGTVGVS